MFVSYKWLQEYVDLSGISADELVEKTTKILHWQRYEY